MANPSAVPASSAGTEILRRSHANITASASNTTLLTGLANYTYTIISIIFGNNSSSDTEELNLWVSADSSTEVRLLTEHALPGKGTFVWNDKIMLSDTDKLLVRLAGGTGDVDVLLTYIENRWA